MANLLKDLIKAKGLKSIQLAKEARISKQFMTQIVSGKRNPTPEVEKVFRKYNLILNNITLEQIKTEPGNKKKAIVPKSVYEVFKNYQKSQGVSDNTVKNYDKSIGRFLKTHDVNKTDSDDIISYLNQFKPNENGYANKHFHWRNLKTF